MGGDLGFGLFGVETANTIGFAILGGDIILWWWMGMLEGVHFNPVLVAICCWGLDIVVVLRGFGVYACLRV